jgi:DNA-binding transcriptional ArsR family regulator
MRDVFAAIADPTRRQVLDLLAVHEDLPVHALAGRFPMGRTAVAKHLSVLREAGLVEGRRVGREVRYRLRPAALQEVRDWVSDYERFWTARLERLEAVLEEES